jgi:hypothetical protein
MEQKKMLDPKDVLEAAYSEAVKASRRPWDFADRCAVLMACAMAHVSAPKWGDTMGSAKFLWENWE